MALALWVVVALSLSILIGSTAAILSWRAIPRPGARWLSVLLVGQVWWSVSTFYRIRAAGLEGKIFWLTVMWVGVISIPLAWVLFALEYSGRDRYVTKRTIALLGIVPFLTLGLVISHQYHDLLSISTAGYTDPGILRIEFAGLWFWVSALYTYLLGIIGLFFLFEVLTNRGLLFRKQGIALVVALLFPWVSNLLYVVGALDFGFDPTPLAFAPSGVIYFLAIRRFRLLRANPAPTRRARQMVFDGVQEGAIIVDLDDHVIDLNERAEAILDTSRQAALGKHCSAIIPECEGLPEAGTVEDYLTIDGDGSARQFEVEVQPISSAAGRPMGRLVTINEVTDLLRQQQRLEVLHRALRHNIRTETNLILGHADGVEAASGRAIEESARAIEALGEKGREAIDLFSMAREETQARQLETMLEDAIEGVESSFHGVTVRYHYGGPSVAVDGLLDAVFRNVVENAADHNTGEHQRVWVEVEASSERAVVQVADDGPGIEDYELAVLEEGTETPLDHASGIGLWIIKWGVDLVDGRVEFERREPTGTMVRIEVPVLGVGRE